MLQVLRLCFSIFMPMPKTPLPPKRKWSAAAPEPCLRHTESLHWRVGFPHWWPVPQGLCLVNERLELPYPPRGFLGCMQICFISRQSSEKWCRVLPTVYINGGLHFCQIPLPFNVLSLNFHKSLMVLVNITYPFFFFIEKNWSLDRLNGFPTATLVSQRNVCMNYEAQRRFIDSPSVIVFTIMW